MDPVHHLEAYLRRTRSLRTSNSLFITTIKPHTATASRTLARWISDLITSSGQQGKGGSVRLASSSKALAKNLTLDSVLEAGEWSRSSTFFRFYNKTVKTFTEAVLEKEDET